MKYRIIIQVLLVMLLSAFALPEKGKVLICKSSDAEVYHKDTCRGLRKCTHEIVSVTTLEAKEKYSRRACKICYN